ncbi:unnamed protein product [Sphagnum jensenii]|uniref:DUF4216 domain-containing protein n=1 Tax=Sphagnum jensenii TaxID=128206 RepID=A0ABP0X2F3_9BRYO
MDVMQLSMKPQMTASRYAKVRAYDNHYRVTTNNEATTMATYDSGVTSVFQQPQATNEGMTLGSIQYVGVLKDIILLNYRPVSQPMVLFKCDWVTPGFDRWGNPTYKQDEDGFLLANFRNLKAEVTEPFVFPSQVQQVFYADEPNTPWWKVVLHKEARSKRIVAENSEEIGTPIDNVIGIEVPFIIPEVLSNTTFVGAIELTGTEAILGAAGL